jgi:UDP-hydrolysing UDP-N-acetyl-D-glucosamine 2-epimerase
MKKRKICVVITARPSYSRIKTALTAMQRHPALELQLVIAASALLDRFGNAVNVIEADGFSVDKRVFMVLEGDSPAAMAKTTGLGILELAAVFDQLRPDAVVTIADRYETMATAVAASYMNISLAHVQGGEISGSIDEKVRHAVTKLADIHLVSTVKAKERVIAMGEDPAAVYCTGCPSIDLAAELPASTALSFDPVAKYGGVGANLDLSRGYIVVMQHPVTTEYQRARVHVTETLRAAHELGVATLWFWPNPDAGSDGTSSGVRAFRENVAPGNIHFFKNMQPADFLQLIRCSRCLVGNSSVGIRESAFLGVPVVNIGSRQGGRERAGNVMDVDYDAAQIRSAIETQMTRGPYSRDTLYGDGRAGARIADVLAEAPLKIEKRLMY